MSYSPIQQTLHPVYQDLDVPRQDLRYYRATSDDGFSVYTENLLDLDDLLLKQCGFLDTKRNKEGPCLSLPMLRTPNRVRVYLISYRQKAYNQLAAQYKEWRKENMALKKKYEALEK